MSQRGCDLGTEVRAVSTLRFADKVREHGEKNMKTKAVEWVTLYAGVG